MKASYNNQLVSVIIPVYNAEKYLHTTIRSVLQQTYPWIEMIFIDDASTDASVDVIEEFQMQYNQITLLTNDVNQGTAIARNRGLATAKGRYVAFLDSDDLWDPSKIEAQIKKMHQHHAALCYAAIDMIDAQDQLIKPKRNIQEDVVYEELLKNNVIACSSVLVDRKLTGHFEMPLLRAGQDYATWLELLRKGHRAVGINEVLVRYRLLKGSVSSNKLKSFKKVWNIYRNFEGIHPVKSTYYALCFSLHGIKKYFC